MRKGSQFDEKSMSVIIGKSQYLVAPAGVVSNGSITCSRYLTYSNYAVFLGDKCAHTIIYSEDRSAMLLGYIVDSEGEETSVDRLLSGFLSTIQTDSSNVAECVKYWGGRWCLLYVVAGSINVITDACGLKQVFYYTYTQKQFFTVASQARYISSIYSLGISAIAQSHIQRATKDNKEYSWPVDSTAYDCVKRLLPNHLLSEGGDSPQRYNLSRYRNSHPSERMAALLKNQMRGLQLRNKCAITLTAGLDSRLVLAAADKNDAHLAIVTLKYIDVSESCDDIVIPVKLSQEVGFVHKIIVCKPINNAFLKRYEEHGENAHPYWTQMAQSVEENGYDDFFWVKGSCNEVLRNSSGILYNWQVDSKVLCKLFQIPYDEFSDNVLSQWIITARPYCKTNGISILDLFYWEHRCGSWLSQCLNESDLVGETFTPFNCRAYLELGLSVNVKKRSAPSYRLFNKIIQLCGLETDIPINPGRNGSLKSFCKSLLKNRLHMLYWLFLQLAR